MASGKNTDTHAVLYRVLKLIKTQLDGILTKEFNLYSLPYFGEADFISPDLIEKASIIHGSHVAFMNTGVIVSEFMAALISRAATAFPEYGLP